MLQHPDVTKYQKLNIKKTAQILNDDTLCLRILEVLGFEKDLKEKMMYFTRQPPQKMLKDVEEKLVGFHNLHELAIQAFGSVKSHRSLVYIDKEKGLRLSIQ